MVIILFLSTVVKSRPWRPATDGNVNCYLQWFSRLAFVADSYSLGRGRQSTHSPPSNPSSPGQSHQSNGSSPPSTPAVIDVDADGVPTELPAAPQAQAHQCHYMYHRSFVKFMSYLHKKNPPYPKMTRFHPNVLTPIKPHHIVEWLQFRAYGFTPVDYKNPNHKPTKLRAHSIEFDKKAISHYMPSTAPWNGTSGNPTRSKEVNDVIKKVKLAQVRGQGVTSKATRDLTIREYQDLILIFYMEQEDLLKAFRRFAALCCKPTLFVALMISPKYSSKI